MSTGFARAPVDVRGEWVLRKLRPGYARFPGASAIVGRGRFDDLDEIFDGMDQADQVAWFYDLVRIALGANGSAARGRAKGESAYRRAASDSIGAFLKCCVREKPGNRILIRELYNAYIEWAKTNKALMLTGHMFGLELTRRGFLKVKRSAFQCVDIELVRVSEGEIANVASAAPATAEVLE